MEGSILNNVLPWSDMIIINPTFCRIDAGYMCNSDLYVWGYLIWPPFLIFCKKRKGKSSHSFCGGDNSCPILSLSSKYCPWKEGDDITNGTCMVLDGFHHRHHHNQYKHLMIIIIITIIFIVVMAPPLPKETRCLKMKMHQLLNATVYKLDSLHKMIHWKTDWHDKTQNEIVWQDWSSKTVLVQLVRFPNHLLSSRGGTCLGLLCNQVPSYLVFVTCS